MSDDDNEPYYSFTNPYERPTSAYFEASEHVIENKKSYTCTQCHVSLSKLMDKSGNTIRYCDRCNREFSDEELSSEIYSEKHELPPPSPIPGFGVNDKWSRVLGRKRND